MQDADQYIATDDRVDVVPGESSAEQMQQVVARSLPSFLPVGL